MGKPGVLLLVFVLGVLPVAGQRAQPAAGGRSAEGASALPAWQAAIAERRRDLVAQNGPGTDAALRDRLLTMRDRDQTARGLMTSGANPATPQERYQRLTETDGQLTSELKQIVSEKGWPTIALVGIDASNAAMLILTHTADHSWQESLLPQLEQMADARKIDAGPLALVIDKQAVAAGRPQRYGSQFKNVNGHMAMYTVEDPGNLDRLRARAMLPPMDVYKQTLAKMYGLAVSNEIVTATPPQASSAVKQ